MLKLFHSASLKGQTKVLGHRPRMLAIGMSLVLAGCSRGSDHNNPPGRSDATTVPSVLPNTNKPVAVPQSVGSQLAAKRKALVAEAVSALQDTQAALDFLAANDSPRALDALARATGKLDIVLAAEPQLAVAPVDVRISTHDLIATPAAVSALRKQAEVALGEDRLQDARQLIADLASEQVITVTGLPLATYPAAIKQAAALVHDGKAAEAAGTLEAALSTLVVEETVIPLPLTRAEALLARARPLSEKSQRSADEKVRLQQLLRDAHGQLDLARALGYATKTDLDALYGALNAIERNAEGTQSGEGLFDRLKDLFGSASRNSNRAKRPSDG